MTGFNNFSKKVFETNKTKGFDVSKENKGQTLMLIVSELAEALEADRKNKQADVDLFQLRIRQGVDFNTAFETYIKDSFQDEIADAIIRLFDLVGALNIDIEWHVEQKMKYNSSRKFKHGKAY